jgi:hypothetical protein
MIYRHTHTHAERGGEREEEELTRSHAGALEQV